ncbi:MAG TPA: hypothetical protein VJ927_04895 [Actinomycetota bacterium]|nr:hypothetical protein [Actinomycetota bacterium]
MTRAYCDGPVRGSGLDNVGRRNPGHLVARRHPALGPIGGTVPASAMTLT